MNSILINHLTKNYFDAFNKKPLLVFSPGRINLIGEHTDYNNGFVLPAAINKGIYAALEKSEANYCKITAMDLDESFNCNLKDIHPIDNGNWKNYVLGVIFEIQKKGKIINNFNLIFSGDLPNGAGLSSSAALENSIVFGLNELFKLELSKEEMIYISQRAEHNFVGVKCGIMDQYASMFGEKDTAILLDCKNLKTEHIKIDFEKYDILLINTNVNHTLAESAYNDRRSVCEKIANILRIDSLREASLENLNTIRNKITSDEYQKVSYVIEENKRVIGAVEAIKKNNLEAFGELLFHSHLGLKNQYRVSCEELDFLVAIANENKNILGARMMGGGFGGCTINLIKKEGIVAFEESVKESFIKKFNFDCSIYQVQLGNGTQLIK